MLMQGESKLDSGLRQAAEHVKQQEQTQTHENGEAQKLVDRIEKKVHNSRPPESALFVIACLQFP